MNMVPPKRIEDNFPIPLPELIDRLYMGAEYNLDGNSYSGLDWRDPRPAPSFTALVSALEQFEKGFDNPDWDGLVQQLSGLVGFATLTTNTNAFTLLNITLTNYRNPELLLNSLQQVVAGMPEGSTILPETIEFVNQALKDNGFDLSI